MEAAPAFPYWSCTIASSAHASQRGNMAAAEESLQILKPTWGDWAACIWSATSCWIMAAMFITAWWWPLELDHGRWVKLGVGLLVLEFILIHSGAFLNFLMTEKAGWERDKKLIGLTAFYTLFAVAFVVVFKSWWIFGSFVLVMVGRIWSVFAGQSEMERTISQRRMAASALLFLLLTFATVFVAVPRGGITDWMLNEVWPTRGGGVWERQPERALAMGATYFLLLGLVELRPPRKIAPPMTAG